MGVGAYNRGGYKNKPLSINHLKTGDLCQERSSSLEGYLTDGETVKDNPSIPTDRTVSRDELAIFLTGGRCGPAICARRAAHRRLRLFVT